MRVACCVFILQRDRAGALHLETVVVFRAARQQVRSKAGAGVVELHYVQRRTLVHDGHFDESRAAPDERQNT